MILLEYKQRTGEVLDDTSSGEKTVYGGMSKNFGVKNWQSGIGTYGEGSLKKLRLNFSCRVTDDDDDDNELW